MSDDMNNMLVVPSSAGGMVVNQAEAARQACAILGRDPAVFRRGKVVVGLVDDKDDKQGNGGKILEVIDLPSLQCYLFDKARVMAWFKAGKEAKLAPVPEIKEMVLRTILGAPYVRDLIRPIATVAHRPYLVAVGNELVVLKPGYNPHRGGILVTSEATIEDVPVAEAVAALSELLCDFAFATPSDKSRAFASFFCAAMRLAGIFERHPLMVYEADLSQSGKTLLFFIIVALFGQRVGTVAQKKGGTGSLDESIMEKMVRGHPFLLLDNVRGKIDSPFLEMALTPEDGEINARILRMSVPVDPRNTVLGLTSNAAEFTRDLANRSMIIRIVKRAPGYQFRTWPDVDGRPAAGIVEHIKARQGYYLGCVAAILRDWWATGRESVPCREHDFRQTMGALDFIVQKYFQLPPLMDGHLEAMDRTTRPGLSWLRQIALRAARDWMAVEWTASRLAEKCAEDGVPIPDCEGQNDDAVRARHVGRIMASAFGSASVVTVDGVEVRRQENKDQEGRTIKTYTFFAGATLARESMAQ